MSAADEAKAGVKRYEMDTTPYTEGASMDLQPDGDWVRFDDHTSSVTALEAERDALARQLADAERLGGQTIDERDRANDQLQEIYVTLGGSGEWSNVYDCGVQAIERAEEIVAERAALRALVDSIEAYAHGLRDPRNAARNETLAMRKQREHGNDIGGDVLDIIKRAALKPRQFDLNLRAGELDDAAAPSADAGGAA